MTTENLSLPAELEAELRTALQPLPASDRDRILATVQALIFKIEQNYHLASSDGLHAEEAACLDALVPGFAERYTALFLRGIEHQMHWETEDQAILKDAQKRGMNYGFIIGLALVIGAVICGMAGATGVGIALAGASAVGMVGKFVDGWRRRRD